MIFLRVNFGFGFMSNALSTSGTTLMLASGHYLPIEAGPMRLVIWNGTLYPTPIIDPNFEVVTAYYSGNPNIYTIVRAQEDTLAHPHAIGDKVAMTYTKGVSSADLSVIGSKEVDETEIGDKKALVFDQATNRIRYAIAGAGVPVTKTLWVDKNRFDSYTQDGSMATPYKTIAAAINRIISNGDNAVYSYLIEIAPGVYYEGIYLENSSLRNIWIHGNGEVIIQPLCGSGTSSGAGGSSYGSSYGGSSGGWGPVYGFRSIMNNSHLYVLHIDNLTFDAPFVVQGLNGGHTFTDAILTNCEFISEGPNSFGLCGGTIEANCINSLTLINCRSTEPIFFNNVWWSYFESCKLEGDFTFTSSEIAVPSAGNANMALFNGTYLQGAISFRSEVSSSGGGNTTFTLVANGSRIGKGNPVNLTPEVTVYALSSFLRGTWTNDGLLILSNSFVQALSPAGIGLVNVDDQPASQLRNDSSVLGITIKDALDNLKNQMGTMDHSLLLNLTFDDSGHVGFQRELIWDNDYLAYLIQK